MLVRRVSPYDFNETDFVASRELVATYLTKAQANGGPVPWAALRYLVGEVPAPPLRHPECSEPPWHPHPRTPPPPIPGSHPIPDQPRTTGGMLAPLVPGSFCDIGCQPALASADITNSMGPSGCTHSSIISTESMSLGVFFLVRNRPYRWLSRLGAPMAYAPLPKAVDRGHHSQPLPWGRACDVRGPRDGRHGPPRPRHIPRGVRPGGIPG